MPNVNITFSLDEDQIRQVKVIAAQRNVTIVSIVRDYFSMLCASGLHDKEVLNGNMQVLFDYSIGRIGRFQAKKILGVSDGVLTTMMRASGFPPPRATPEQEDAMLEEIKDIRLV
ncbi:hypothetical protein [Ferrovum sp.]|uniref:hypothetical protein n=1 Tax=Ferrovum sp. TaxID=2609467 RepID=UPI00260DE554|nr:hypothetical protein [Ferrovum sp.]